jgi:type VI secretion system secreted protein Hcp
MAYEFYVTVESFPGESPRRGHEHQSAGISFEHEIVSPRDVATGQPSGARQHKPIRFTKEWGKASPLFFEALVNNRTLRTVQFDFYRTSREGKEKVYYSIQLTDASVCQIRWMTGKGESASSVKTTVAYDTHELEEISFTYSRIDVTFVEGGIMASDDWNQPELG